MHQNMNYKNKRQVNEFEVFVQMPDISRLDFLGLLEKGPMLYPPQPIRPLHLKNISLK